jgi:hypothetical protein
MHKCRGRMDAQERSPWPQHRRLRRFPRQSHLRAPTVGAHSLEPLSPGYCQGWHVCQFCRSKNRSSPHDVARVFSHPDLRSIVRRGLATPPGKQQKSQCGLFSFLSKRIWEFEPCSTRAVAQPPAGPRSAHPHYSPDNWFALLVVRIPTDSQALHNVKCFFSNCSKRDSIASINSLAQLLSSSQTLLALQI